MSRVLACPCLVQLTKSELHKLKLTGGGIQPVRIVLRALALLTTWAMAILRQNGRLDKALTAKAVRVDRSPLRRRRARPSFAREAPARGNLDSPGGGKAQRIIAMVCSDPPEGQARWTVRLVAEEAVKRKLVPRVGRETIRVLLHSHDLKPWREKNVVRGRTE